MLCHHLGWLERARKREGWSCSLECCQALWDDTPPTIHIEAHLRLLQDSGLTGEIDATLPFLPFSVYLVIMLHEGCVSIQATEFARPPCAKHRARQEVTDSISVVGSFCSAIGDSRGNSQLVITAGLNLYFPLVYTKCLAQCLAQNRHSVHID